MIIELLTIGRNKLTAIGLVRRYGGMSLVTANDLVENLPATFNCAYPYEKIDEIMDDFTVSGCTITVETGHRRPPRKQTGFKLSRILFSKMQETIKQDQEKIKLTNKNEVLSFLKNRQDFPKAIGTGILATFALWIMFGSYFFKSDFILDNLYKVSINIILGLMIAFSIRLRGRGVEPKFGMLAAIFTAAASFGVIYIYKASMVYRDDYSLAYFFKAVDLSDMWYMGSLLLGAFIAYFSAFEKINENPPDADLVAKNSGKPVSELIAERSKKARKDFSAPHKSYLKKVTPTKK